MLLQFLTRQTLISHKKNLRIYRAPAGNTNCIWKCCPMTDHAMVEAFRDEYETLRYLNHPSIPVYLSLWDNCFPGDAAGLWSVLCIEECPGVPVKEVADRIPNRLILKILKATGQILSYLLASGIIYTDLNLSNLLLQSLPENNRLYLVDYTCSYYFLRNPNPTYSLCFSYDLSPDQKGQQLLIQELAFLFEDLVRTRADEKKDRELSSSVLSLYESGKKPSPSLSLKDYICQIDHCLSSQS